MVRKPKITEEFLCEIYELFEGIQSVHQKFAARSWKEIVSPEWREFRLAYEKKRRGRTFSQMVSYLKQKGYIKTPQGRSVESLWLTEKGKRKALAAKSKRIEWPDRKDGKMIMLLYDIPKEKSSVRYAFREALVALDYQMFQKSVWVSRKDVLGKTQEIVHNFFLDSCVDIFVIEEIRVHK